MAALNFTSPVPRITTAAHEFMAWWTAALTAALPGALRSAIEGRRRELYLDVRPDELLLAARLGHAEKGLLRVGRGDARAISAAAVRQSLGGLQTDGVVVRLAATQVFRRLLTLPGAAARNLRAIVANEIDRRTPFKADQVYFDVRVLAQDPARRDLTVELVIAKRALIDQVVAWVTAWGLPIKRISVLGTEGLDLLRGRQSRTRTYSSYLTAALVAAAFALGATSVILAYRNLEARAASAAQQVGQARAQALSVEKMRTEVDALQDQSGSLTVKRQAASPLDVLREITALLPDDVWAYQIRIGAHEVHIAGFAPDASSLIGKFEHSKLFENPRFRAPVTRGSGANTERFDFSADIRAGAPP
jgi:general secretion pathway protein L